MIAENELRLGNWVYNDENKPVKMVVIETPEFAEWNGSDCQNMFIEDGNYKYSTINPIPLTPEIIENAGFVKSKTDAAYYVELNGPDRHFDLVQSGADYYPSILQQNEMSDEINIVSLNYIQSVHQLQNLYFALTGKELNITF